MKMVRVLYRLFRALVCTVAFVFCYMILKASLHQPSLFVWLDIPDSDTGDFRTVVTTNLDTDLHKVASKTFQNFTCSASKEVIPSDLDQSFQEFLRYRHCRAFPTLLTPSPCEDDLCLLLAIKSTPANRERRAALRDTWGRAGIIQGRRVKLVFLTGRTPVQNYNLQSLLEKENLHYGDILQWDFVDIFFNLPRKEVEFLSWFSHMCSSAQFVFKGDDDVFVNTENLVRFLTAHKPENHLLVGYIHPSGGAIRDKTSKYFIPAEIYPEGKLYPSFPSGGGYLMSQKTVLGLNVAAQKVKLFPLDDVFLGMCLQQMGVNLTHHKGFLTFGLNRGQHYYDPCVYRGLIMMHTLSPSGMRAMWRRMHDSSLQC